MAVILSSLATATTTSRAFAGQYLSTLVDAPVAPVSLGLLAVLTVVSLRGIQLSARVNVALTLVEIGGLLLVIGIGSAALVSGEGGPSAVLDVGQVSANGLLTAMSLAFFAFLGFEDAVHLSEEVAHPRQSFPRVLFGSVAIAATLYLAVVLVSTMLIDSSSLAASDGPLLEVVNRSPSCSASS
ncbi:MAG: APA family basic amino acid/polyamine antiporter [Candidatus Poriferisodalaceae bacterium]|jgi:APA family basic amino acid/polyamine antiporter